jgi:hypothetical protein
VFLDEPTTGLDSEMALSVMRSVSALAHSNRLVVSGRRRPEPEPSCGLLLPGSMPLGSPALALRARAEPAAAAAATAAAAAATARQGPAPGAPGPPALAAVAAPAGHSASPQLCPATRRCRQVATIHQPNSDITDLFDDYLLLARGRALYAGRWALQISLHTRRPAVRPAPAPR